VKLVVGKKYAERILFLFFQRLISQAYYSLKKRNKIRSASFFPTTNFTGLLVVGKKDAERILFLFFSND
jgi:hypothetical protein